MINDTSNAKNTGENMNGAEKRSSINGLNNQITATTKKPKRKICSYCQRPIPRTCLCSALPHRPTNKDGDDFLKLFHSRIVVLQHPHEARRMNRSLPLVQLCFPPITDTPDVTASSPQPRSSSPSLEEALDTPIEKKVEEKTRHQYHLENVDFHTIIARRLGNQIDPFYQRLLHNPDEDVILLYPSDDAISLTDALARIRQRQSQKIHQDVCDKNNKSKNRTDRDSTIMATHPKITLLFLDGTWKYAKEINKKCIENDAYPKQMIRVKLDPTTDYQLFQTIASSSATTSMDIPSSSSSPATECMFRPRRFDIRTPPSPDHLSTAECIALVTSIVEGNVKIYQTLMKPLDLMVKQWHSFYSKETDKCCKSKKGF